MTTEPTPRHFTASMVVIDTTTARVLLIHHNASGLLQFPGGHVDPNEAPHETAIREVLEETGLTVTLHTGNLIDLPDMTPMVSPFLTAEIPAPAKPARPGKPAEAPHLHIDFLYIGHADSTTPTTALECEVSAAIWVPINTLHTLPTRAEVPHVAQLAHTLITTETGDHK